jgi:hypothetical protein
MSRWKVGAALVRPMLDAHDTRRKRAQRRLERGLVDVFLGHSLLKIAPAQIKLGEKGASS